VQEQNWPGGIEVFQYPDSPCMSTSPDWVGFGDAAAAQAEQQKHENAKGAMDAMARSDFELRLAEETRRSFEAGRERGRVEGSQAQLEAQSAERKASEEGRMRKMAELVEGFAQERDRYLQSVEREVVKLALGVAARILRREAQMDPLLLTGAVRVALGQLSRSTEVRLRVPAAELDLWTEAIALLPNLALKPTVTAGEGMRLGDCVIETALGSVDLGIRSQLGEIERGFFDRAGASKPQAGPRLAESATAGREIRP